MECGRSSGVEHNLAKVGVEGSNPFARSRFPKNQLVMTMAGNGGKRPGGPIRGPRRAVRGSG
jgi:hypothetical protein